MKITAIVNGFANANNEKVALAVDIVTENRHHEKAIPLKPMTINAAELAAATYACKSIHPDHIPLSDLLLHTCNPYLVSISEKVDGHWKASLKTNIELVNNLRGCLDRFKSFKVELDLKSELMQSVKVKARAFQGKASSS